MEKSFQSIMDNKLMRDRSTQVAFLKEAQKLQLRAAEIPDASFSVEFYTDNSIYVYHRGPKENSGKSNTLRFYSMSIVEAAQWLADLTRVVEFWENDKNFEESEEAELVQVEELDF